MNNLGGYETLTTVAKRVGGPEKLVVLIAASGAATGAIAVKVGELVVKKGKQAINKRKEKEKELAIKFDTIYKDERNAIRNEGLQEV